MRRKAPFGHVSLLPRVMGPMTYVAEKPMTLTREDLHGFTMGISRRSTMAASKNGRITSSMTACIRSFREKNMRLASSSCTIQADSKGMLVDRVQGILKTQMYAPRYCRRFYSGLRVVEANDRGLEVRQNVVVIQTLLDKPSQILGCGVGRDCLVRDAMEISNSLSVRSFWTVKWSRTLSSIPRERRVARGHRLYCGNAAPIDCQRLASLCNR